MRTNEAPADTAERLRASALAGFRAAGFGGAGVDGLARAAGLTSGAFYAHFGSKAGAFRAAIADGLAAVAAKVRALRLAHGADWLDRFVDFYLVDLVEAPPGEGCALPLLTADVARAEAATRETYAAGLAAVVAAIAAGLSGDAREARARAILMLLAGAAGVIRAVPDRQARETLRAAVRAAVFSPRGPSG